MAEHPDPAAVEELFALVEQYSAGGLLVERYVPDSSELGDPVELRSRLYGPFPKDTTEAISFMENLKAADSLKGHGEKFEHRIRLFFPPS